MNARHLLLVPALCLVAACSAATEDAAPDDGLSSSADQDLKGCKGKASSSVPSNDVYDLTSFGGPGESGIMSCGDYTKNGSWYYAASRQRYGCGAHVKVEANGKCVVVQTDDYGPDVCVENAAGRPILDASPLVSKYLFGTSSAGWSDGYKVTVTEVSKSTKLGPCDDD
ncbi:MAG TPA: hypothetical protein VF407_17370 [Polyangiaceae bacterium]